jgi:hypothetical protein
VKEHGRIDQICLGGERSTIDRGKGKFSSQRSKSKVDLNPGSVDDKNMLEVW